jgi:hypothetical protein
MQGETNKTDFILGPKLLHLMGSWKICDLCLGNCLIFCKEIRQSCKIIINFQSDSSINGLLELGLLHNALRQAIKIPSSCVWRIHSLKEYTIKRSKKWGSDIEQDKSALVATKVMAVTLKDQNYVSREHMSVLNSRNTSCRLIYDLLISQIVIWKTMIFAWAGGKKKKKSVEQGCTNFPKM